MCRKNSNAAVRQVETPSELTSLSHDKFILSCDMTSCHVEVTIYHDCKTHRCCKKRTFSLTTCELLRSVAQYCALLYNQLKTSDPKPY